MMSRLKKRLIDLVLPPSINAARAMLPPIAVMAYQHRGASDAEALGIALATVVGITFPLITERMADRYQKWWAVLVADETKTDEEVVEEIRRNAREPAFADAIMHAANAMRNVIAEEAVRPLGALTREYGRGTPKSPDRFFRGVCAVLCDSEAADIRAMSELFRNTTGNAFDDEDPIVFTMVNRGAITAMPLLVARAQEPLTEPTPAIIAMPEPDRIAHMLLAHRIAKVAKSMNKCTRSANPVVGAFHAPRYAHAHGRHHRHRGSPHPSRVGAARSAVAAQWPVGARVR